MCGWHNNLANCVYLSNVPKKLIFSLAVAVTSLYTLLLVQYYNTRQNSINCVASSSEKFVTVAPITITGLGNCMFQYASLLGIAETVNKTPIVFENEDWQWQFNSALRKLGFHLFPPTNMLKFEKPLSLNQYFYTTVRILTKTEDLKFEDISIDNQFVPDVYQRFLPGKNYKIQGYLEGPHYFEQIKDRLITGEFRFRKEYEDSARYRLTHVRQSYCNLSNCIIVGLHVRRGEKALAMYWGYTNCVRVAAGIEYIRNAVRFYEHKFGHNNMLIFAVLGDDFAWNHQYIPQLTRHVVAVLQPTTPASDMRFLSLCDHLIINIGTFGFWAGYLSRGDVVYPEDYGEIGYYLPEWTKLPRSNNKNETHC